MRPLQRGQCRVGAELGVGVAETESAIGKAAADGGWSVHHDGFWSSQAKGTFQRGITEGESTALARQSGLQPAEGPPVLPLPGICHAVLTKPTA
ncbi:hypothetical protein ACG93S_32380 [Streptomyces sp. WAC01490]|uniref:hypothetical protein n=1 Tax=unclassified Streptomyces TaxID=2593676 RepID=UPI003F3D0D2C